MIRLANYICLSEIVSVRRGNPKASQIRMYLNSILREQPPPRKIIMNNIITISDETEEKSNVLEMWSPKQDGFEFSKITELFKKDGFSEEETLELAKDTADLLGKCIDPKSIKKTFNSTGLVIGQIQSGKTSSMEGL